MAKPTVRLQVVAAAIFLGLAGLLARAADVQLVQGGRWAAEAQAQRTERVALPARRGALLDRKGTPLAVTEETYHVGLAPNELRDPDHDAGLIAAQLHVPAATVRAALRERYAYFAGPYSSVDVQPLRALRGVHLEPVLNRFYPRVDLAASVIGRVSDEGRGTTGLELALDSVLAGRPGAAVVLKDREGRQYVSPARVLAQPVSGNDVFLTLDAELQDIAQRALDAALARTQADGGDVIMLDPATGEVLAAASERRDGPERPSAFTDAFEPGSIVKIFAAAALIERGLVSPTERVSGEGGRWRVGHRLIVDEEPLDALTLADAIRVSSNIAIVQFADRLSPAAQYTTLRDFGFGIPTGVEFPGEAGGRLRLPSLWRGTSQASLAMGYELAVTPIQVAAAYAALAAGGVLMTPTLIREVRGPDGTALYRHLPEPVRRAVTPAVADSLRALLRAVVEHGTGTEASLAHFAVAAKTGTARRVVNGRYVPGDYTASFAALFPADHPQLVIVVKIEDPRAGSYFAAETAAPLTRAMLEQALAARDVPLERARLAEAPRALATGADADDGELDVQVVPWPHDSATSVPIEELVPAVAGRDVRAAVRVLRERGFEVVLNGSGTVRRTEPAAGDSARAGTAVTVFAAPVP
ncbi:MAG TPA: penicillin-binding transpeptidase domain-containing protein [Gemmatimonadales bacterium]|nr:penicillin-binding transpeptidase domain-containing protein [Gemmatimonadales bacterium]